MNTKHNNFHFSRDNIIIVVGWCEQNYRTNRYVHYKPTLFFPFIHVLQMCIFETPTNHKRNIRLFTLYDISVCNLHFFPIFTQCYVWYVNVLTVFHSLHLVWFCFLFLCTCTYRRFSLQNPPNCLSLCTCLLNFQPAKNNHSGQMQVEPRPQLKKTTITGHKKKEEEEKTRDPPLPNSSSRKWLHPTPGRRVIFRTLWKRW